MPDARTSLSRALEDKARLVEELRRVVGEEGYRRALRDPHARRRPIPCGMTVHTGVSCSYGCLYCYIFDMGFTGPPRPYSLSGEELTLALALNPYLVPGPQGTLLAFGSVTEPFMRATLWRAMEYLSSTRRWLGNPQQVSTKTALEGKALRVFLESAEPGIDVLVSISTIRHWRVLEPGASPPEARFRFMSELVESGISVTLFLRPIILGVTDMEASEILEAASRAGVRRVVLGTLRVTDRILARLKSSGLVDVSGVEARMPRKPRRRGDQVPMYVGDIKERIAGLARSMGLQVLPASCSANIVSHGQGCAACKLGPCGALDKLPHAGEEDLAEAFRSIGIRVTRVRVRGGAVEVVYKGGRRDGEIIFHWIVGALRRRPVVRRA